MGVNYDHKSAPYRIINFSYVLKSFVQDCSNLPMVVAKNTSVEPHENENEILVINYSQERQGFVIADQEIESHCCDIHTALLSTFLK